MDEGKAMWRVWASYPVAGPDGGDGRAAEAGGFPGQLGSAW